MSEPTIDVFVVDDHEVVRSGLCAMLQAEDGFSVVGEAATVAEAVEGITSTDPDVAIIDLHLPDGTGTEVCRTLRPLLPGCRFMIIASVARDDELLAAVQAGVDGIVLKHARAVALVASIRRVASGHSLLDPRAQARLVERLRHGGDKGHVGLTPQEQRILDLLGDGLTNREIAARLRLSDKTVKNYVSNVLTKLGMHRRAEAAAFAAGVRERAAHGRLAEHGCAIRY